MTLKLMGFIGFLFFLTPTIDAQETAIATDTVPKTQTLFGAIKPKLRKIGFYVAPEFQYLGTAGTYAPASGGSAMLIFNERLSIGVAAYEARSFSPKLSNNAGLQMSYGYGGLAIGYTVSPHKLVHLNFPILIGAGYAQLDSTDNFEFRRDMHNDFRGINGDNRGDYNPFFTAQLGANVEMNVFKILKVYVGGSYRIATSSDITYPIANGATAPLSNSQLSGLTAQAGVKLGLFDISTERKKREHRGWFKHRDRKEG
jgi:hypothetical protein